MEDLINTYIGKDNVKVVIEAGTLNCEDSVKLAQMFPNSHVYCFEPNPSQTHLCRTNVDVYNLLKGERISFYPKALGAKAGMAVFRPIDVKKTTTTHSDGNPGASSFFLANQDYPQEKYVQTETLVEVLTLEKFCKDNGITEIDALWLDAQSSELNILKGLGDMISKVKVIQTEVLFKPQYHEAPLFEEVDEWLEAHGFRFAQWVEKWDWFGNALYIRTNL